MKQVLFIMMLIIVVIGSACQKDKAPTVGAPIDFFAPNKVNKPNALDSLIDTLHTKYAIRIIYRYDARVLDPSTFYIPANYPAAKEYVKVVLEKLWLDPLSKAFPEFFKQQTPLEFLLVGNYVHFNSIDAGLAAGAGLNGQFYRLGMGGVNGYTFSREWLRDHIATLYHEHAHQLDHKFGRPVGYDRVSQGDYYFLSYYTKTDDQAQKDGFFRAYGGFAREEDFATSVEAMIRFPKEEIDLITAKNPKLLTKYKMVYEFYKSRGLDLHELQKVVEETVVKLVP